MSDGVRATSRYTVARSPSRAATNIANTSSAVASVPSPSGQRRPLFSSTGRRSVGRTHTSPTTAFTWRTNLGQLGSPHSRTIVSCALASVLRVQSVPRPMVRRRARAPVSGSRAERRSRCVATALVQVGSALRTDLMRPATPYDYEWAVHPRQENPQRAVNPAMASCAGQPSAHVRAAIAEFRYHHHPDCVIPRLL